MNPILVYLSLVLVLLVMLKIAIQKLMVNNKRRKTVWVDCPFCDMDGWEITIDDTGRRMQCDTCRATSFVFYNTKDAYIDSIVYGEDK